MVVASVVPGPEADTARARGCSLFHSAPLLVWGVRLMGGRDYPPEDFPDTPTTADREHGVGGTAEFEELPGWAQKALAEHGITAAPDHPELPGEPPPLPSDEPEYGRGFDDGREQGRDEGYKKGYDEGWDRGRVAAMNQGFSDAWDSGWRACQIWFIQERRRRAHRRAGLDSGGYCGKTGVEKPGDCPCRDEGMENVVWPPAPPKEDMRMSCSVCGTAKNYWKVQTLLYEQVYFCYYCEQVTDPKPV